MAEPLSYTGAVSLEAWLSPGRFGLRPAVLILATVPQVMLLQALVVLPLEWALSVFCLPCPFDDD